MRNLTCNSILIALLSLPLFNANAQSSPAVQTPAATANSDPHKSAKKVDVERSRRERGALALSLLISLANDVRSFDDQSVRARMQARIADALWEIDAEQGRALFRRAWDAGEIADKERQQRSGESGTYAVLTSSREEVLLLAAQRDRALGEELLRKLNEQKQQDASGASKRVRFGPFDTPDEGARQRLNLARQLLDSGDVERAIQFADSALAFVNIEAVDFLSSLREKNPTAADQRYAAMLAGARANLQSDADTVSLLSSYIFTPHLFVTSQGRGALTSQSTLILPTNVAPQLTAAFFRTATDILIRQFSRAVQNQNASALEGRYPVINHLLQLFDRYGRKDIAEALRAQLVTLAPLVSDGVRQRDEDWRANWISPAAKTGDREQSLLDQIDHAKDSSQRDQLYLQLALIISEKGDARARDFVDKIEESELRKEVRAYINADLAIRAIENKEVERALDFARPGELTHIQRLWVLTQAAKLLSKTDREKSLAVLDEAAAEARRIDGSDPDRPRALMAVASVLLTTDHVRAWDAAFDAVKAANSSDGFTGEDGTLTVSLVTNYRTSLRSKSAPDFDVAGIFSALAKDDYSRAIELARGFERVGPRASAVIAIARSIMDSKKSSNKPATRAIRD